MCYYMGKAIATVGPGAYDITDEEINGEIEERPAYYLVTFVFHDQNKNIVKQVQKLVGSMRTAGFDVEYISAPWSC